ncbi:MAG TPA: hypothetical protein VMD09_05355 [Solirubrobacteraceae bacterium]|nr:hypothetical protein [Solirubrobacteraceae bacterium]
MSRAGKLGATQVLLVVASLVAGMFVARIAGPVTQVQLVVLLLLLEFVVYPVSTLIHELGHAAVARRVTREPVSVVVGRAPYATFALDQVRVNFSFLPSCGVSYRGVCRFNPAGVSSRNRARIALAGPAATLVELCIAAAIGARVWDQASLFGRNLVAFILLGLVASLVVNLIPRNSGPIPNDGAQALAALKHDRAQTQLPIAAATRPSTRPRPRSKVPMSAEVKAYAAAGPSAAAAPVIDPEHDVKHARKSVPPPDTA